MTDRDSLSSVFIFHVKILFDILDENRTGLVKLSDIERHWEGNDCIIPGSVVIQCLKNVASPTGHLSFDTLIIGLERAITAWKSNNCGHCSVVIPSSENQLSSSGYISNCTTTIPFEPASCKNIRSAFESVGHSRYMPVSSSSLNGLVKSADAEYNGAAMLSRTNVDDPKLQQQERTSARDSEEYARAQKTKGNHFMFMALL